MTTTQRILFTTSLFLLATSVTYAAGLVPCGGPTEPMCRVCDFIVMGTLIIVMLLMAGLLILSSTAAAPFIYTLF